MKNNKPTQLQRIAAFVRRHWDWGLLVLVIAFTTAIRIRYLAIPLERDEGEYAYMAQLMLQGIPPYVQAYSMKLPGIYAVYALIMTIFGQSIVGIHFALLLANTATIVLVFLIAKRLFDRYTAVIAGIVYALLSLSPTMHGVMANAEPFVLLPMAGGLLLLLKAIDSGLSRTFLWSGVLLGLAFVIKQHGVFFALFAGLYVIYGQWQTRPARYREPIARTAVFALGAAIPFAVTCLALLATGAFARFWFWTFEYAHKYTGEVSLSNGIEALAIMSPQILMPSLLLFLLAGVGLLAPAWDKELRSRGAFLIGFFVFSFLTICPGFYFRPHYYLMVVPSIALLVGAAISSIRRLLMRTNRTLIWRTAPILIFLVSIGHMVCTHRICFFDMTPLELCRSTYGLDTFPEAIEVAKYLKSHTDKNDRVAILGSEPEILFYSHRRSATGFIYMYPLVEAQEYAATMQKDMIREVEAANPRYLIFVNSQLSWTIQSQDNRGILGWFMDRYVHKYQTVGLVDVYNAEWTQYLWDEDAADHGFPENHTMYIFRRKD